MKTLRIIFINSRKQLEEVSYPIDLTDAYQQAQIYIDILCNSHNITRKNILVNKII